MIRIGPYTLSSRVVLAPMAGVTDLPFRRLCRRYGAGLTPGEMLTSNTDLWQSAKNSLRRRHYGETEPRVVQIAGSDPGMMASAARMNVSEGAQIIDINMGCPARKVLKKAAGSALLKNEKLVAEILHAVVGAVDVPVTLKIRTGWCPDSRNATSIARIAEDAGIASLAVHGRTRECRFLGEVEYDTIASVRETVSIPVFANGDIDSPQKAQQVLSLTGADGIMIGRAAYGRPWIFSEINHFLQTGRILPVPENQVIGSLMLEHISAVHQFYGEIRGVLVARKHLGWYLSVLNSHSGLCADTATGWRSAFNALTTTEAQLSMISGWFPLTNDRRNIAA